MILRLSSFSFVFLMVSRASFSAENTPTLSFGGRIQADRTSFENDKYSYQDGSELRRGRLYIRGNLDEDWEYRVQYDFAPDDPELKDGYIRYNGFRNTRITFGHFKQFSSLEELTSSNNITFTERALPNALTTSRRIGVGLQRWNERYSFATSVYSNEANNSSKGEGLAVRMVYRPEIGDGQLFHLGINYSREDDEDEIARFRARPESHQDSHRIVDTSKILGVEDRDKFGLEAAFVRGRFSAQGEYIQQSLSRNLGADVAFDGYYAYASYFITSDTRPYSNTDAAFGTVNPTNSGGAWELAARVSHLDLSDKIIPGGSVDSFTIGINYYMTRDLRFVANYIMTNSDRLAGNDDPKTFQFRIRYTF